MNPFQQLRSIVGRLAPKSDQQEADEQPALMRWEILREPAILYAIGDVHGCFDKLQALENLVLEDCQRYEGAKVIVLLGDYIDRGPDSAKVIEHLMTRTPEGVYRICLRGNHEEIMLDVLRGVLPPEDWLRIGGTTTIQSYGFDIDYLRSTMGWSLETIVDEFAKSFPQKQLQFLERLPVSFSTPSHVFVHAGVRSGIPMADQSDRDLLWIRGQQMGTGPLIEGKRVVHGHTPARRPVTTPHRICIDTGAYAGGPLTAVRLIGEAVDFVSVS